MPGTKKKHLPGKVRKVRKKRSENGPLKSVISMRIGNQEKMMLEKLARSTSRSVSEIMREAMDSWKTNQQGLCPDV